MPDFCGPRMRREGSREQFLWLDQISKCFLSEQGDYRKILHMHVRTCPFAEVEIRLAWTIIIIINQTLVLSCTSIIIIMLK